MNFGSNVQKEVSIRFCGAGGMGVILASIILGRAAIADGKNSIQTQSYGAEQRGTKVKSDILISEFEEPTFPLFNHVDILIAFSQDAFNHFFSSIKKEGIVVINEDLVETNQKDKKIYKVSASTLAEELKNSKIMNIIMLGSLIKLTNIVSKQSIIDTINTSVPKKYKHINIEGFRKGYNLNF
ncbi:MAG: 2-oxoglutarate synthase subunit KorC [Promethearchaeota archaeon]|jgi:2-oxoglutarate ferredoxin oxidoreductase subunit gamma|nr:MAG: 2-oxoglutarate synthase subunit KorC [Candidatus Lokiarchaeota archaeon]